MRAYKSIPSAYGILYSLLHSNPGFLPLRALATLMMHDTLVVLPPNPQPPSLSSQRWIESSFFASEREKIGKTTPSFPSPHPSSLDSLSPMFGWGKSEENTLWILV